MRPLYIGATVQDSGKTCMSMGLMHVLQSKKINPGYFKPVGQHYVSYKNKNIDEDAVLIHQVFGITDKPYYLSPIAIEKGFTANFIFNPDVVPLEKKIVDSVEHLNKKHPMVIVEGTGHAGVGSCFGLSNARVAQLLNAKVVIVTGGGIGRPIDEIALSMSLFQKHNVEVIGVVLNKVLPEKYEKIKTTVARGLQNIGTKLLGAIPYEPMLTFFTVGQLVEHFKYTIFSGSQFLSNRIERTVVAAMEPKHALKYIKNNTLVIATFDRAETLIAAANALKQNENQGGAMIITGCNEPPDKTVQKVLQDTNIPVLCSSKDTFTVSSRMKDLEFKIRTFDSNKIDILNGLVEKYVDTDYIFNALKD